MLNNSVKISAHQNEIQQFAAIGADQNNKERKTLVVGRLIVLGKRCQSLLKLVQNRIRPSRDIRYRHLVVIIGDAEGSRTVSPPKDNT